MTHPSWLIMLTALVTAGAAVAGQCPTHEPGATIGTIGAAALTEISGLAVSRQNPGVLWAHNDSGDSARAFAMTTTGAHLGIYALSSAAAIDWEDMAIGPGPSPGTHYLYMGDIGDNANNRPNIKVYRVPEPAVDPRQSPMTATLTGVETITLTYPDGPRDAETLMVDVNGDVYVVSKRVTALGRVYRAAFPQSTSATITMQFVAELPWGSVTGLGGATGGDIAADGSAVIVRRYTAQSPQATMWLRPPGAALASVFRSPGCNVSLVAEAQGEAIALVPGSLSYYSVSEGSSQPLHFHVQQFSSADFNHDGHINGLDLALLLGQWTGSAMYAPCPPFLPADLNQDCRINGLDLAVVLGAWTG